MGWQYIVAGRVRWDGWWREGCFMILYKITPKEQSMCSQTPVRRRFTQPSRLWASSPPSALGGPATWAEWQWALFRVWTGNPCRSGGCREHTSLSGLAETTLINKSPRVKSGHLSSDQISLDKKRWRVCRRESSPTSRKFPDPQELVYVYMECINLSVNYYFYLVIFRVWVQGIFNIFYLLWSLRLKWVSERMNES